MKHHILNVGGFTMKGKVFREKYFYKATRKFARAIEFNSVKTNLCLMAKKLERAKLEFS